MNRHHHIPQRSISNKHNVSSNNINTSLNLSSINNLNSVSNARLKEINQATNLSVCLPKSSADKSPISRSKDPKTRVAKENITSKTPPPSSKKNDKQQQILKGVLKSSYTKLSSQPKPQNTNLQRLKFEKSCAIIIEPLKNKDSNRISHLYSFSHRRDSASSKTKKEEIPGNNHKSTSRILQHNNPVKSSLGPAPTKSFFAQKSEKQTLSQILRKSQERINTLKNEKVLEELESQQNESSFFSMNYQYRRQSMGDAEIPRFEPTQNKRLSVPTLMTQEFETENTRCKTDYFIAKDECLYRANLFGEKLNGLLKGLILKQKMGFFMKLRENMHLYQWKLSKFAKAQEAKKKGFYFRTWEKFIRVKKNKFPCASARLNKTTFENPKTTAAEAQKLTLKKLLDKNMQSFHLNLNKILEEEPEPNHLNKSIEAPKEQSRFYAKKGSAPDVSMFDLKLSSNNNFHGSHSHSQSVIFNPVAFKDSDICNNSLETSFASISEKNCKNQQNNLLRKSEDLLSFKQSQASNEEQHSLGINLSSFNKDYESHNTSMTDQILTNIPQPAQRDGLDISAYDSFSSKEKAAVVQKKPTSTSTSKISQPKIKQNITTVNKDKPKFNKRPENGMYIQMKQDLEKKIQQSMSATKVVKKTRNESFIRNNESQETEKSIRKDSKPPVKKPKEKSVVKFEKILPQAEQPETKVLQKSFEKKIEDAIIESNHQIIINNEKALQFRKIKLIQTYFNRLLLTTQLVINRKNEAAEYLQIRNLLKKGFIGLSTGTMSIVAPENEISFSNQPCFGSENHQDNSIKEEEELEIKMQIAENYYETTTKMNIWTALMENAQEKSKSFDEYRKGYLMRACFVKWFENKSILKEGTEENPDVFAYEGDLPTFRSINNENEEKVEKEFE